jgi:hypothetical protein
VRAVRRIPVLVFAANASCIQAERRRVVFVRGEDLMVESLYNVPAGLLLVGVLIVAIVIASGGQLLVHRWLAGKDFVGHNEVGGIIIAVSGAIYAVILGFLTIMAWEHFQEARMITVMEANADIDAWHNAVGLPPAIREQVRAKMMDYATIMVEKEWPLMKHGAFDPKAAWIDMEAIDATGMFTPANSAESNAQSATLQHLTIIHDAGQRRRTINNEGGISWFEWTVLLVGAVCIICFCWLFGVKNIRTHLVMTATVVTMITSILVLLFELQMPYRSDVGVGPVAWQGAIAHMRQMIAGDMMNMR